MIAPGVAVTAVLAGPAVVMATTPPADGGGICNAPGIGAVCGAVGGAVGAVANTAAQTFVDGFADGFATLVKTMTTFWVDVPTPTLSGSGSPVAQLQGLTLWLQGIVLVASLLYVASKTALSRRGEAMKEGAHGLGLTMLAVGAGAAGVDLLTVAGDNWSKWIIDSATNGDMTNRLGAVTGGSSVMTGLGIGLEFMISLLGILSCIVQIFLLLARVGVLTLLVGTLPLTAAGIAVPMVKASFTRIVGWIIAFVLYKPAAAMVYAAAFSLTGKGSDLLSVLSGLMLILLAVLALPALMRLVAPMVAAASGGGGGALSGALVGGALATGARDVGHHSAPPPSGGGHTPGLADKSASSSPTPSGGGAPSGAGSASSGGEMAMAGAPSGAGAGGAGAGAAGAGEAAATVGAAGVAGAATAGVGAVVIAAGAAVKQAGKTAHAAAQHTKSAADGAANSATGGA